ncbi:hypothetical protein BIV09_03625 [Pseudomonas sp. 7SR1]|nr:hypothetical protein BIV09_03625 [Pseudomonas sp. 7SR1]
MTEQDFFEALMEPSLHRKVSPSHPAIPPLRPEHGVLAAKADADRDTRRIAIAMRSGPDVP